MGKLTKPRYAAWLDAVESGKDVTLGDYAKWLAFDDGLPWRLDKDHLADLLERALERIWALEADK